MNQSKYPNNDSFVHQFCNIGFSENNRFVFHFNQPPFFPFYLIDRMK